MLTNVMEVLNETRLLINKGKISSALTTNQKKAMVDILQALEFYSQQLEKFSLIVTIREEAIKQDSTVKYHTIFITSKHPYIPEQIQAIHVCSYYCYCHNIYICSYILIIFYHFITQP